MLWTVVLPTIAITVFLYRRASHLMTEAQICEDAAEQIVLRKVAKRYRLAAYAYPFCVFGLLAVLFGFLELFS